MNIVKTLPDKLPPWALYLGIFLIGFFFDATAIWAGWNWGLAKMFSLSQIPYWSAMLVQVLWLSKKKTVQLQSIDGQENKDVMMLKKLVEQQFKKEDNPTYIG